MATNRPPIIPTRGASRQLENPALRRLTDQDKMAIAVLCQHTPASFNLVAQLIKRGFLGPGSVTNPTAAAQTLTRGWLCQVVQWLQSEPQNHVLWARARDLPYMDVQPIVASAFQLLCLAERNPADPLRWVERVPPRQEPLWTVGSITLPFKAVFFIVLVEHTDVSEQMLSAILTSTFNYAFTEAQIRNSIDAIHRNPARSRAVAGDFDRPRNRDIVRGAFDVFCSVEAAGGVILWDP